MDGKGDTERQAALRDIIIERSGKTEAQYISRILRLMSKGSQILDIGCGTGHILQRLGSSHADISLVGLDISHAMLQRVRMNTRNAAISLVAGDGCELPFLDEKFDVTISRLSPYSADEIYRTLRRNGSFLEYGLGPEANKEVTEFFPDRLCMDGFAIYQDRERWLMEVGKNLERAGLDIISVEEFKEAEYYSDSEELMDLIEMVPLVRDFNRLRDEKIVNKLAQEYEETEGIRITWHYYILEAGRE